MALGKEVALFHWKWGQNSAPRERQEIPCCNIMARNLGMTVDHLDIQDRASDFFQDWWAEGTRGAKSGGSFF